MEMRVDPSRITQPVDIEKEDEFPVLTCRPVEKRTLRTIPHLSKLLEAVEENQVLDRDQRYIIVSPREDLARQAAAAVLSCLEEDREEEDEEIIIMASEEEEGRMACLMLKQEELTGSASASEEVQMIKTLMDVEKKQALNASMGKYNGIYVSCGSRVRVGLADRMEELDHWIQVLWVERQEWNEEELERLMFERDFRLLCIQPPDIDYYAGLLQRYLKLEGFCLEMPVRPLIERLLRYRGQHFCERDLFVYAKRAAEQLELRKGTVLEQEDFVLPRLERSNFARKIFCSMVGREEVKSQIERICSQRIVMERFGRWENGGKPYGHLAFSGAPGTGKTQAARAYAEILAEEGIIARRFVTAGKSDLTGQFLGQTAPKIVELFDEADGGVLFVDEVGCLTENDLYSREAVTEFVRLMEERPQTTVIFASYPDRIQMLMELDPGLASRISRVIRFPSYTDDQLIRIFHAMCGDRSLAPEPGCDTIIGEWLQILRQERGEAFGNAREIRRLLEASFQNYCVRILRDQENMKNEPDGLLGREDVALAARELLAETEEKLNRKVGFAIPFGAVS